MSGVRAPQWPPMNYHKRVVVIGGGTGTYSVLLALKKLPVRITAIVSMADSGGSNRVIRDEFGLLPTSDIRQAMVALSSPTANQLLRQLFTYRYNNGTGITGMTFGNLFMAALTDIMGSQSKAIKATCKLLKVRGKVIPITYDSSHLLARYDNNKQILGEHFIDEPDPEQAKHRIIKLEMVPQAVLNPLAARAIKKADYVILPPGDFYTSMVCNLLISGVTEALRQSSAQKIYFINLMTRFGQTNNFTVRDHIDELMQYLDGQSLDYVIINKNKKLPEGIKEKYQDEQAKMVKDDLAGKQVYKKAKLIRTDLVSDLLYNKPSSDVLTRSLVRHDPAKIAAALASVMVK